MSLFESLSGLFFPLFMVYVSYHLTLDDWRDHFTVQKKDIASVFTDARNIVFWCAVITLLMSAGGPVCESGDMFGCDYYRDDYREPLEALAALKLFFKAVLSCGVGYLFAYLRWKMSRRK